MLGCVMEHVLGCHAKCAEAMQDGLPEADLLADVRINVQRIPVPIQPAWRPHLRRPLGISFSRVQHRFWLIRACSVRAQL